MKRIAHISSSGKLEGGAEFCLLELVKEEIAAGIQPVVFVPEDGNLIKELNKLSIEVYIAPYYSWRHPSKESRVKSFHVYQLKRLLNTLSELNSLDKFKEIDLIHINTSSVYFGLIAAKKFKIPVVWHIREFNGPEFSHEFYNNGFSIRKMNYAVKEIAVSNAIYNKYCSEFDNIETVYDSIDFDPLIRPKVLLDSGKKIEIVLISNKMPAKGQLDSLIALKKVIERKVTNVHLSLVGKNTDAKYCKHLDTYIQNNNLERYVTTYGFIRNSNEILAKSDIALNCSRSESFGRTTVEAMIAGCLVIGNDNTCTHELLMNKRGLLYKDTNDLASQIIFAIQHRETCRTLAENGKKFAIENFTKGSKNVIKQFIELI